ncbi:MAG: nucleotide exchange factor GrpE [Lutisporaceae bacterium]
MKRKDNKEKATAPEAVEVHMDKTTGINVDISEEEATSTEPITEADMLKSQLEEKTKQCEENYNRFLRMQADFENYKKRVIREREELYFTSLERVLTDVLPIIDNMERAIAAFKKDNLDNNYVDGVDMIYKQLFAVLEKNGLKEIEAAGQEFDPNLHHAVMQVQGTAEEENKIKEVLQKGYFLGSKVIRPAMVQVVANN